MSFEAALAQRLLMSEPVAALVGNRVDWMVRPQGAALPAITLMIVSDVRTQHHKGFNPSVTRVQIDVWAADFLSSIALREAVIAAVIAPAVLEGIRFQRGQNLTVRPEKDTDEDGTAIYRQIVDLVFTHNG